MHTSDRVNHKAYHFCISEVCHTALAVAWFTLQGDYRLLGASY